MCEPFEIKMTGTARELIDKTRAKLQLQGGTLTGDEHSGKITLAVPIVGIIEGNYSISGNVLTITVTEKPALLPCGLIQSKITDFLES